MQIASDFYYKSPIAVYLSVSKVGQSNTRTESLLEIDWLHLNRTATSNNCGRSSMLNYSYSNGRYALEENPAVDGKKIELVPQGIFRTALTVSYDNKYTVGMQWSWTESNLPMLPMPPSPLMPCMALFPPIKFWIFIQKHNETAQCGNQCNNALNDLFYAPCLWISRPGYSSQ